MENVCHRYSCEVAFADTDASGWAHFSKILTYAERAEHDLLALSGISVFRPAQGGWPRVRVSCDYSSPLCFQDKIEVRLSITRLGRSSVSWRFGIFKDDDTLAAEGEMVSVKVDKEGMATPFSDEERRKLEALS